MKSIETLEADIDSINADIDRMSRTIDPLRRALESMNRELRKAKSLRFIAQHGITRDQVESSSPEDKPWFGHIRTFGKWLSENSNKKWCEWNGEILPSEDVIKGFMPSTDGRYEDLPATVEEQQ